MAEEGDFTPIKDGSDADFDIVCNPCVEGNIREEAVKYCPECQEYLCTACTLHHGRLKFSRSHKLLDRDSAKQGAVVAMTTKCLYHPDRDIEMYCKTHDMVYCLKCIATEHRSCSGVTGIEEINIFSVQQIDVERLQNEMENVQERLQFTDKDTKNNLDCLEEQKVEILAEIEEVERSLLEHIRKLKREAIQKLNKDYALTKGELKCNISQTVSMKKEIESASSQLQIIGSLDVGQQFVQMKLIQKTVNDAVKLVEKSKSKGSKAFCFTENTDLKTSVTTATSLGQVNTVTENKQTVPRLYKVKSKKKVNVKLRNDRSSSCYIIDVCQLHDGTIILADQNNMKIKRLHGNYTIKDHCDLGNYPMGICCTGQNEVAMKMYNDKVQFISVGTSLSTMREISVASGYCCGMTYCAGELWISTGSCVNVYSTTGTLLKTISKDANNVNLFKSYTQHIAVSGETVIVADDSDGAVCLGRDGTVKRELRDSRLKNTRVVCVSSDGTVFLSGYNSNNIVMFDKDGNCLGELVDKDAGLVNPLALHYDNKAHLIAACKNSNNIVMFDISD